MRKGLFALFVFALAAVMATDALAYRGRTRVYVGVGGYWGPYWGPYYYYPYPYYYQPAPEAPVYVERIDPAQQGYWYYCEQEKGYYPYVKECPAGWRRVPAAPPPG